MTWSKNLDLPSAWMVISAFFKTRIKISVHPRYVYFIAVYACQFIITLSVVFSKLLYFFEIVIYFDICFARYLYVIYFFEVCLQALWICCSCRRMLSIFFILLVSVVDSYFILFIFVLFY